MGLLSELLLACYILKDDEDARDALVKKFGAQNVARRIEFRKK